MLEKHEVIFCGNLLLLNSLSFPTLWIRYRLSDGARICRTALVLIHRRDYFFAKLPEKFHELVKKNWIYAGEVGRGSSS